MEVIKTLRPGDSGTKKLTAHYGDRLVCVRYRKDVQRQRRFTTIELIVDEIPSVRAKPFPLSPEELALSVGLYISADEADVRRQVMDAGGVYDQRADLWRLPLAKVVKLGLLGRLREG